MCVEESLTVPRQVSDGDAGMEGLLVELLAVPQLRFPPPVSTRQLQLRRCLATQDCIPAVILALSLVREAQALPQKALADSLAVARHKKMSLGALAGASNRLYAIGTGNTGFAINRPDERNEEATAHPMAPNTADDAVPSAKQHSQHAACNQEEADLAATQQHCEEGAGLLGTHSASQHQQLHNGQRGGAQLSSSYHMTTQEWALHRLLQACQLQHPRAQANHICFQSDQGQQAGSSEGAVIGILQILRDHVRFLNDLMYACHFA
jgi:hypothetical protein